jgi:hypothetical protein
MHQHIAAGVGHVRVGLAVEIRVELFRWRNAARLADGEIVLDRIGGFGKADVASIIRGIEIRLNFRRGLRQLMLIE